MIIGSREREGREGGRPLPQALSASGSFGQLCAKVAAEFALTVIQDGDYSKILLRLEYLNRTLINSGQLPDSIVAGIGSAIACLSGAQQSSVPTYRADSSFTGRRGRPSFNVSEDQLVFLVDNVFTITKISEMLGISKRMVECDNARGDRPHIPDRRETYLVTFYILALTSRSFKEFAFLYERICGCLNIWRSSG